MGTGIAMLVIVAYGRLTEIAEDFSKLESYLNPLTTMGRYIGPGGIVEDDYGPIDRPRSSKINICIMQKFQ